MTTTNDRRMLILETLIERKQETMERLAMEFGVTRMTIYRDIQVLSCSYPITTNAGGAGGVRISHDFRLGKKYLTSKQATLLQKLSQNLEGEDLMTMNEILSTFGQPVMG